MSMTTDGLLAPSPTMNFADVAHQTLIFEAGDPSAKLVLDLLETAWVQRLRRIRQTGNTHLVYMFAEHSRFGHSLGVAYLSLLLMRKLSRFHAEQVEKYRDAVAVAALLHDIGHTAPGSHLATKLWSPDHGDNHELISARIIQEDPEIRAILEARSPKLPELVTRILKDDPELPPWTVATISGGGWNADRGNWTIVDSAMCSVSYGRYNVAALIDAFRLSEDGRLILLESRVDALTHFFVARDSMYRQVYLHRVLQSADALSINTACRLRDIVNQADAPGNVRAAMEALGIFCDDTLVALLECSHYARDLSLDKIFLMNEHWWFYHIGHWCSCKDEILRDLALRQRDRRIFKTVRLADEVSDEQQKQNEALISRAQEIAAALGYDPRYYVVVMGEADRHRRKTEAAPGVLRDDGTIVEAYQIEPLITALTARSGSGRNWLAVPKKVKEKLGRYR